MKNKFSDFTCYWKYLFVILLFSFNASNIFAQLPTTPRIPVTDTFFGLQVTDPYRWMENSNDSSVIKWFQAQDAYAENLFRRISGRDKLLAEYNYLDSLRSDVVWCARRDRDGFLFLKYDKKEENVFLLRRAGYDGKDEVMIDFKKILSVKPQDILFFEFSPISRYVSFHIREGNHEATTIYFYNVASRKFFPEQIRYSYGGIPFRTKFTHDGSGFFYFTLPVEDNKAVLKNSKAKLHKIGTSPASDKVLASAEDYPHLFPGINKSCEFEVTVDPDFKYLLLFAYNGTDEYSFVAPYGELEKNYINWIPLTRPTDKLGQPVIRKGVAYFVSKKDQNQQLVKCELGNLSRITFKTLVPPNRNKLDHITATSDYLLLRYTDGITNWYEQYNLKTGKSERIPTTTPGIYRAARMNETGNEIEISITSWNRPSTAYILDAEKKKMWKSPFNSTVDYPGTDELVAEKTEVPGHDGAMIPLSIVYHKNTKLDGKAICVLNGYGAYGIVITPSFSVDKLVYCKRGVVFAYAHVRGGGEKGEPWRLAGFKATKPNSWKDFISCAEWLIKNKYTSAAHLIAQGASAGGITVGRAVTERPDLFAVVINRVGSINTMRIAGGNNATEFGSLKDSSESRYLYEMDALQHINKNVAYPAVLCTAGMTDGRVPAWEPGKFAAALQYASSSNRPVLLQVYWEGGHFGESVKSKNINSVNEMAFALWQAGHPDFQLKN